MKYIEVRTNVNKKLGALSALGIVAFAPFFGVPQNAQADPPDNAPAWGWRRRNADRNTDVNQNRGQRYTITGTVTNDRGGNGFTMRTDNGRTLYVQTDDEPRRLSDGDRVSVFGFITGSTLIADSVRVVNNRDDDWGGNDGYSRITVRGIVTRDLPNENAFEMRTDSGRVVRVRARNGEPRRLSSDQRVEVSGYINGNRLRADNVRILDNNTSRTVRGTVTRLTRNQDDFEVQLDNGRTVMVRARRAREQAPLWRITRDDRVTLEGRFANYGNEFLADRVLIKRDDDRGEARWVNFAATVLSVDTTRQLRVRADNGTTYTVDTRAVVSSNVDPGDRVRVTGRLRDGVIRAERVEFINRGTRDRDNDYNRRNVNFPATVIEGGTMWGGNILTVRGDNSREYRVSVPRSSQGNFRRGDRVRIVGTQLENNRIQATSVTRQ